ncbi:MAG: histidinol dehydrogenase [Anaerolineales bacterium]
MLWRTEARAVHSGHDRPTMLKIYDVESARRTILQRTNGGREDYPPRLLEGVERIFGSGTTPREAVSEILQSVRGEGDPAVRGWTHRVDGLELEDFIVEQPAVVDAFERTPAAVRQALGMAAERIRSFHERQPIPSWTTEEMGGRLGQRFSPIRSVGVYVPGKSAPLPSSLLMSVIPALVAGVERIVVCTPPPAADIILAAAHVCGLESLYQIGGAQAIGAMTYGTESVPKVDKIVGAGNLFVSLAKQQVFGEVGIDGIAGPTETVIIGDAMARPSWVAADLLAQAEHDPMASAILITPSRELAEAVQSEVERRAAELSRAPIILESLSRRGGIVLTEDLATAAVLTNEYAPEHLCLSVTDPVALAKEIRNAGGLFVGERSFEVLGDYVAGPSHIMPTGGTARFASPLNVLDFVKITSWIELDDDSSATLGPPASQLAEAESLTAHAAAAQIRMESGDV